MIQVIIGVAREAGSPGLSDRLLDGVTRRSFTSERYTGRFVVDLIGDLKAGVYRPEPARRIFIPKPDGRQRLIGIAVDQDGNVLDISVQRRHNQMAAEQSFRKVLQGYEDMPRVLIMDTLGVRAA